MTTPAIRLNGGLPTVKLSVAPGAAVIAQLDDVSGVRTVDWAVVGSDEITDTSAIVLTQYGAQGEFCSFDMVNADGRAILIRARVNGGSIDPLTGATTSELDATAKVYTLTTSAGLEVAATGERYESDSNHGWTGLFNGSIRSIATVGSPQITLTTSNATPTTATTYVMPADGRLTMNLTVMAVNASGGDTSYFTRLIRISRAGSGSASADAILTPVVDANTIGGTCAIGASVSVANLLITVTGVAATTIKWFLTYDTVLYQYS
jgi:hypothetical protein